MLLTRRFTALNGAAIAVGVLAGLAAVLLRYTIDLVQNVSFMGVWSANAAESNAFIHSPWGWAVIAVPALGGLAAGGIRFIWPETRQQGIAEVMAAVQAKGGILKARSSIGHSAISALTVGTGGSTGREGPIAYIGAALGSSIGRRMNFRPRDIKVLLGCGFASGIGATFNAPLGGVLLALELVLPEFSTHAFIPLVLSTVAGVSVFRVLTVGDVTFHIPGFVISSPWELFGYLALGILCGLGGVAFIRIMSSMQDLWRQASAPDWAKPMVGGLLVGIIGYLCFLVLGQYHVFGTGYATVTAILRDDPAIATVLVLVTLAIVKPLATSLTIGSGGAGGVFSASLYQGALYGGLVGLAMQTLWPGLGIHPGSYALVGMGAFYAAAARATLTAIVMVAELTNDYTVVLPVMFAAVTADAVSVGLSKESIYTGKLAEKGILYDHDRVQSPLDFMLVREVMSHEVATLPAALTCGEAFNRMLDRGHTGFPVVDAQGRLVAIVTRRDLSRLLHEGKGNDTLGHVLPTKVVTATPDEVLHKARDRLYEHGIGRLVVVDAADPRRVLGILTRSDLLRAEAQRDVEHSDAFTEAEP